MHPPLFPSASAEIVVMLVQNAPAFIAAVIAGVAIAMLAIYHKLGKRNV